jgi:NAD(P)-dependent dehydrogenase (short-subunit alcohol dehydrogenase family)
MRNVLITGGTGTIGRRLVKDFMSTGYRVTFQYGSRAVEAAILESETGATGVQCELSDTAACLKLDLSMVDVLVNNAAVNDCRSKTSEVQLDQWLCTLAVNLTAPFMLCRSVLPGMVTRGWGRIINISSIYGLRGTENNLPYTVSKHGLSGLTKTIAREYGGFGITCNEICPGPVDSELLNRIASYYHDSEGTQPEDFNRALATEIPVGRLASAEDIASCASFLASESSGYVNGVSLPVDGGLIT